ncbi:UDP-glycosyltransferase [Hwangdonia lutea]|uniref:UDP-glycosyltransferase n=1 Tax=Hwangdonia lutea TaxID=3075823 RepID=A0AA97EM09_9FLAO|nr:UDP-glycosyltransferase [Hwangdonia sp. SCSIO 19198]WOD43974.1 UDP-glycosyltransferase [Hwangdonia sp. SCSIO 19198]
MAYKILVVVDSIDVNDSSGSKANVALIKGLLDVGFQVSVYHYTRRSLHIENAICFEIKEKKSNILYLFSRAQRVIQRTFKINLAKYLEPLFGFSFTFFNDVNSIKAALSKVDISNIDLVLTLSKAASFRPHYVINQLPRFHHKWMAYIHDPYPFNRYPKPYDWKEPGYKIKERFFHSLSNNAKYAAFPSLLLKEWMGKTFKNFNITGIVIPHQIINVNIKEEVPPAYFENEKFNVLHAGSLMKQRNPEGLIKGFQLFLENNVEAQRDSRLILIGGADYHEQMIENYAKRIPQLEIHLRNIPFQDVNWLQNHVSANIILEANAEESPFLPGKFPHCVWANKPIIHLGPEQSETRRLLGSHHPYCSVINNVNNIAEILQQLYLTWKDANQILTLDRLDLEYYLGKNYLKSKLEAIFNND